MTNNQPSNASRSNELSVQQKVVITRNGSTFYLAAERADRLQHLLRSPNKPEYIELDDTLIAVREITMVAPAEKVEELNMRKQGMWQCASKHWHTRAETVCKLNWGAPVSTPVGKLKERERSPEAKAKGARIKELLDSGVSLKKALQKVRAEFSEKPPQ